MRAKVFLKYFRHLKMRTKSRELFRVEVEVTKVATTRARDRPAQFTLSSEELIQQKTHL